MLHKWRRQHLAGELGSTKATDVEFLPVALVGDANHMADRANQMPASPPPSLSLPKPPMIKGGAIEIRYGKRGPMFATDGMPLLPEHIAQHATAGERMPQMQFVDAARQRQVG
jgi:hypothetical protein